MATRRYGTDGLAADEKSVEDDACVAHANGKRCKFPATIKIGADWYCRLHYRCPHGQAFDSAVEESYSWDVASRSMRDVPLEYRTWDGRRVAGFPTRAQIERAFSAECGSEKAGDSTKIMAMLRPKPPSKAWAHELRARESRGERLLPQQARAWREALERGLPEREPGSDDE